MSALRTAALWAAVTGALVAQAPINDTCSGFAPVVGGVNPSAPGGVSGQTYSNLNATDSAPGLFPSCVTIHADVFFTYIAFRSGPVTVKTCTPPGFAAGTLNDTVVAVYLNANCPAGGVAPIACNDDGFGCTGLFSVKAMVTFGASAGQTYMIRVGSASVPSFGTFYLTIDEPAVASNNTCGGAVALPLGVTGPLDMIGGGLQGAVGCPDFFSAANKWYSYTTDAATTPRELTVNVQGDAGANRLAIYSGPCGSLVPLECGTTSVSAPVAPSTTYWIRVGRSIESFITEFEFDLALTLVESPTHDECAAAFPIGDGVHPTNPAEAVYCDNFGATDSAGYGLCSGSLGTSDVWFSYLATTSGKVRVATTTPPGKAAATLTDTVVFVYGACGGPTLACNDDSGSPTSFYLSELEFDALQGATYFIRVADFGATRNEGTFWLTIEPKFRLELSSPSGPGSFRLRDEFGAPFHAVFNVLTLQAGSYPYGPFFGIEPTLTEITLQLAYGQAPFIVVLDGAGAYQADFAGLPPLTVYGVAIAFDGAGSVAGVSKPAVTTIN